MNKKILSVVALVCALCLAACGNKAKDNAAGEAIDLGLSVKWADRNIGATCPEDGGAFLCWGEVQGKPVYKWSRYAYGTGMEALTKYNTSKEYGEEEDDLLSLEPADDAATVNWGENWRTPTKEEIQELIDSCQWAWETVNEVEGYRITGPNGNSIFLPACGYVEHIDHIGENSAAYYWARTIDQFRPNDANALFINPLTHELDQRFRCYGRSVRAVCE